MRFSPLRSVATAAVLILMLGCAQETPAISDQTYRATPQAIVKREEPELLLDLPLGPESNQPGSTSARIGGISPKGPRSMAVDRDGLIYLWDSARARVMAYDRGKLVRVVELPYAGPEAGWLQVYAGRLYLRTDRHNHQEEIEAGEADGRLLRLAVLPYDGQTIYRRPREGGTVGGGTAVGEEAVGGEAGAGKTLTRSLGSDALGYRYETVLDGSNGWEIRRVSDGRILAVSTEPKVNGDLVERFVAVDGRVYALAWIREGQRISRVQVFRLLKPAGGAPAEPEPLAPDPPVVAGKPVPDSIRVSGPGWAPISLDRAADRQTLWRILEKARPNPKAPKPHPNSVHARLTVGWSGGGTLEIELDHNTIHIGGDSYWVDSPAAMDLLSHRLSDAGAFLSAARNHGIVLRIPDLPGAARRLTPSEAGDLTRVLKGAFPVRAAEPERGLEAQFPVYELVVDTPGNPAILRLAGQRHIWTGLSGIGGALAHGGGLTELAGKWLPVPPAKPGEVAYLYRASGLTIQGPEGQATDLTRWKDTVVRHLLGVLPAETSGAGFQSPLVFSFTVDGRPEVVSVTDRGFTYSGKFRPRSGLLWLASLQGVP